MKSIVTINGRKSGNNRIAIGFKYKLSEYIAQFFEC